MSIYQFLQHGGWGIQACLRKMCVPSSKKSISVSEIDTLISLIPELIDHDHFWNVFQKVIQEENDFQSKVSSHLGIELGNKMHPRRLLSNHAQANTLALHVPIKGVSFYPVLKIIYHPNKKIFTHQWYRPLEDEKKNVKFIIALRIVGEKTGHVLGCVMADDQLQVIDVNGKLGETFYSLSDIKIPAETLLEEIKKIFPARTVISSPPEIINSTLYQIGQCVPFTFLWLELYSALECQDWKDVFSGIKERFTRQEYIKIKSRYISYISHQMLDMKILTR